jgi:response regulator of citrate/malate metabolism
MLIINSTGNGVIEEYKQVKCRLEFGTIFYLIKPFKNTFTKKIL